MKYDVYQSLAIGFLKELNIKFLGFIPHRFNPNNYVVNTNVGLKIIYWANNKFNLTEYSEARLTSGVFS